MENEVHLDSPLIQKLSSGQPVGHYSTGSSGKVTFPGRHTNEGTLSVSDWRRRIDREKSFKLYDPSVALKSLTPFNKDLFMSELKDCSLVFHK